MSRFLQFVGKNGRIFFREARVISVMYKQAFCMSDRRDDESSKNGLQQLNAPFFASHRESLLYIHTIVKTQTRLKILPV